MKLKFSELTLSKLDVEEGLPPLPPAEGEEFPLPAWHRAIYHTPLSDLEAGDVARAIEQNIHLKYMVLVALVMLRTDPMAGDFYDGHVLVAMESVPKQFWKEQKEEAAYLKTLVEKALSRNDLSGDVHASLERTRQVLS